MLLNLAALAVVAFAFATIVLGLVEYFRTRQPRTLGFSAVGLVLLVLLFLLASRFALQLLGSLPIALDLQQFALGDLLPLAVTLGVAALVIGIALLARRRVLFAYGLTIVVALTLLAVTWGTSLSVTALAVQLQKAAPIEHPTLREIQLPEGFQVQVFAQDVQDPSALAFDDQGNLYYAELVEGNIVRLRDTNTDGTADEKKVFASGFQNPRGLVWHDGKLYVSSRGQINRLADTNGDGVANENQVILDGLFSLDIQHSNNGITFGPDGKLYIAIGGPRVHQLELRDKTYWYEGQSRDQWMFGGILVADADGKNLQLYARGLRNPYSLAFSADGKLYATDNGDDTIPVPDGDELNLIAHGADYGYPYFFGLPPDWSGTRPPVIAFPPHRAPTGVVVYDANAFPKTFQGNVFVALFWRGLPKTHYREVVRVLPVDQDGKTTWTMRDLVEGLDRPTALAVGPDGALYIADMRGGRADPDFPGVIYRVSYTGK